MIDVASFRFIHAADLHLDSPFKGLNGLPDAWRKEVQLSTFAALDDLIELAIKEQVDFVLFSGDVYDLRDRSLRAQLKFRKALERLTSEHVQAYIIHGNHDPLDGQRAKLDWPQGVHFFDANGANHVDRAEIKVAYNRAGEAVALLEGISYPTAAVNESLVPSFADRPPPGQEALYRIGMLHSNVDGDPAHDNYAPCSLAGLTDKGIHYWALGHIHAHRILQQEPWVVYSGCTQGRHMRETGPKGCCVVSVSGRRTEIRFQALDQVRWCQMSLDIETLTTEQDLVDAALTALQRAREDAEGRNVMLRLNWIGRGPLHSHLQNETWVDELLDGLRDEAETLSLGEQNWVWPESLHVQSGMDVSLETLRQEEHFLSDLLRLTDRLIGDEQKLQVFVDEAVDSLVHHRQIGKHVRDRLAADPESLLIKARELALDLLLEETKNS